jgi:hypothetical protein
VIRALALAVLLATLALGDVALAESHAVTVQNGTGETIRSIVISPIAGSGDNRLRSTLPPGAAGRITYSTGCQANVRIGYESGRTEDHSGVDVCSDPRIVAGTDGLAGPAAVAGATPAPSPSIPKQASAPATQVVVAPRPVVPPWTGKSIIKRFGGMD